MKWAYNAIVKTRLTFGCFVWAQGAQNNRIKHQLKKIQRLAFVSMCQLRNSTLTAGLEVSLGFQTLHLHIQEIALKHTSEYAILLTIIGLVSPEQLIKVTYTGGINTTMK